MGKKNDRRSWLRVGLSLLPKIFRFPLIRRMVTVSYDDMPRLEIRIAQTSDELEQAYRILHDSYVDQGYMTPSPTGMRVIKYFALPSTTTLVALWDGKIVGTMSIIRKTSFGLPIENAFNIEGITDGQAAIAEVSSLAISKEFRMSRGLLFFPFCKFFFEYSEKYLRLQRIVIAVHPSMADFYEGILGFEVIQKIQINKYDFANGNPAVGLWADFGTLRQKFQAWYQKKDKMHNLNYFFTQYDCSYIKYPERLFVRATDPVMTTQDFIKFFITQSNIFNELSRNEKLAIQSLYPGLTRQGGEVVSNDPRKSLRFLTENEAQIERQDLQKKIRVLDVSQFGLRMQVDPLVFNDYKTSSHSTRIVNLVIKISERENANISAVVQWVDERNLLIGLRVVNADTSWDAYLCYLSSSVNLKVA